MAKEEAILRKKLYQKAINTFDHNCGRKKSTFIRYNIQNHGCAIVGCRLCGKTPKSKTKTKGMRKLNRLENKMAISDSNMDYDY